MSFVSVAVAGIGVGTQVAGMIGSRKARKKQESIATDRLAEIESQKGENQNFYDTEYNKDYFDTNVAKSAIDKMDRSSGKAIEASQNASIRGGGTADSEIATRGKIQEAKQEGLSSLASQGTAHKSGIRNQFLSRDAALGGTAKFYDEAYSNTLDQQAEGWGNLAESGKSLSSTGFEGMAGSDGKVGDFLQKSGFGGK